VGLHEIYGVSTQGEHEKNYSSEFSALQEASVTLQCFVRLQVLWSHESENNTQADRGHFEQFA